MTGIDPLKDIPGVKEFQERALVRAVRLTRENAEAIARRARKRCGFTPDGRVMLVEHTYTIWALEGGHDRRTPGQYASVEPHPGGLPRLVHDARRAAE